MATISDINEFLQPYDGAIARRALQLRAVVRAVLPGITEQIDTAAKMIGYCYGQKYSQLICVIIPSKKGLKLGFNRGTALPDPHQMLEGKGKISRYLEIETEEQINSEAVDALLKAALSLYEEVGK